MTSKPTSKPTSEPSSERLALVASSGGHLAEMFALRDFWGDRDHFWVSFPTTDAKHLLQDEDVVWAHYPTNRNVPNLLRNTKLAVDVLRARKPTAVLSTGAGVGVPFLLAGRAMGMRTLYLESLTRISSLSMSGRLVYPFVEEFWVQWPELARRFDKAKYRGTVV